MGIDLGNSATDLKIGKFYQELSEVNLDIILDNINGEYYFGDFSKDNDCDYVITIKIYILFIVV